jgi:uracil-DNA glycosylase family 4
MDEQGSLLNNERATSKQAAIRQPDGKDACRDRILGCTNCGLWNKSKGPVPYGGKRPSRVCIIGEAPGFHEDSRGIPFIGPAGRLLRSELQANKVRPDNCFYCNIVSCFPKLDGAKTPKQKHIQACRSNSWAQIEYSQATWVLVVGGMALEALAPWLLWKGIHKKITAMRGTTWFYKNKYWVPVIHPAAALRQSSKYRPMFQEDIKNFVEQVRTGIPAINDECFSCSQDVEVYDETGIAWCMKCDPRIQIGVK